MVDTIALMKQRVLNMAIRGELVEQREEEGSAKDLLSDIKKEKDHLIKVKEIKQDKLLPEIKNENIPFDIPESWVWTRLSGISKLITDGAHKTPTYVEKGIPFLSVKNISQGTLNMNNTRFIPEDEHLELIKRCHPEKGDILFCRIGTLGKPQIIEEEVDFSIFVSLGLIKLIKKELGQFLKFMIDSPEFYRQIDEVKVIGSHASKLNLRDVRNMLIPLPPLAEQKRIVAKIKSLFIVIDQIGTRKEDSLAIIEKIRQTSLQSAIMGQLVEQDGSDEPASELVKKIQVEKQQLIKEKKVKKENTLSEIIKEDIPYAIPINWEWVRLGDVTTIKGGKRVPKGNKFSEEITKHVYLRVTDMHNQSIETVSLKYLTDEVYEKIKSYTISKDELYLTIAGTIGRVGLIPEELDNMSLTENACKICPYNNDKKLLMYFLMSPFTQNQFQEGYNQSAQPKLSIRTTSNTIIPLPPLVEQKRIVEKLDQIMAICDQMEALFNGFSPIDVALKVAE